MAFAFSECTGLKMTKLCVLNMNYTHLQRHERCIVYLKKMHKKYKKRKKEKRKNKPKLCYVANY